MNGTYYQPEVELSSGFFSPSLSSIPHTVIPVLDTLSVHRHPRGHACHKMASVPHRGSTKQVAIATHNKDVLRIGCRIKSGMTGTPPDLPLCKGRRNKALFAVDSQVKSGMTLFCHHSTRAEILLWDIYGKARLFGYKKASNLRYITHKNNFCQTINTLIKNLITFWNAKCF